MGRFRAKQGLDDYAKGYEAEDRTCLGMKTEFMTIFMYEMEELERISCEIFHLL